MNDSTTPNTQPGASAPTPTPPAVKRWTPTRIVVVSIVAAATLVGLTTGGSWSWYRLQHVVIDNATVKGRVHRIGARIDGQVKAIEVQPGQRISRGEVLVRLADDHFQAALRQAQSELQSAIKRFDAEKSAIAHEHERLPLEAERCENVCKALTAEVKAAESTRDRWENEFNRAASLISSGTMSASELDAVKAQRDGARAQVETAQGNLAAAESDLRIARVQIDGLRVREAGLEVLAADIEQARQKVSACDADLAATVIRAPEDGWVIDHIVEPGGSAKVGEAIVSVWLGAPWVEAWVDEKKLSRIKMFSPVDVTLAAFPDHRLRGRVEAIGVLADKELQAEPVPSTLHSLFSNNAMIPIRIAVPGDEIRLQPGLSALVGISRPHRANIATASRDRVFLAGNPISLSVGQPNEHGKPTQLDLKQ